MPRTPIPIIAGEGRAPSKFISSRTLVNCYLESAMGRPAIYGGPGYRALASVGVGPLRGLHNFNETLLAVVGNTLYTVNAGGSATSRGTILGADPVSIDNNGTQALIVAADEEVSYVWDGSALTEISDPDLSPLSSVAFIDQYMAGSVKDASTFQISALADAEDWNALDVATAETRPDKLRRVFVDSRDLLLMGERTIEGWVNTGASDFPFERTQLFVNLGLMGRDCVAAVDNTFAFLANDGTVRVLRGATPVVISTPAVAHLISQWSDPGSAQAFSFSLRNHQFWALRHPDGCVLWDSSAPAEEAWHVRKSYASETWAVAYAVSIWGQTILGARSTGALYTLDADEHTEAGETLVRSVISEPLGPGGYFTLNEIELQIEPGVGVADGDDPKVTMRLSRDSGRTWGARLTRSLGGRGGYERRIVFDGGFGQFRPQGGVLEIAMSDDAAFVLKGALADYEVDA